ncbi:MAG: hypothetical protein E6J13_11370 [Chloroflexi bacterium]|nr:MAG: hypothetical protein E6J13_11370 [Chloroflexota bacterium]
MRNPRSAAAAFIRERAPAILPRVVEEATAGESSDKYAGDLQRRLTAYLERRIPPWLEALEASNSERPDAIRRLLRTDAEAGEHIPPVVLLGTVALGYRVMESEIRSRTAADEYSAEELWAEVDLLRRTVVEARRDANDSGRVA